MITSDWKHEDMLVHKELLDILDILVTIYRRTNDEQLVEEITKLYAIAQDINHRIKTFAYPVEKVSLSHVKRDIL